MKAALTKITQWVRSRDGSGILRSIWSGAWTSQKIWEVKYIRCYYLKALVTFAFSQKGWEGRGHLQGPQLPALVTLLLHFPAGREEPHQRGLTACCCPRAGVINLTAPWACSEPMPACNPSAAGNKSCLKCMLNHSSLLLLLLLLALLLAPSGLGPQSHLPAFWAWGWIRKAKKIAKLTQYILDNQVV